MLISWSFKQRVYSEATDKKTNKCFLRKELNLIDIVVFWKYLFNSSPSVTLVLVLSWITRYYRNKYLKLQNATNGIDKIDEELYECQNDEDNKHITNSTTSGEFENVFPYRDQIEHFLTATRDLRKSRKETKIIIHSSILIFSNLPDIATFILYTQ